MSYSDVSPPCIRRNTASIGRDLLSAWATKAGAGGPGKGFKSRYFILFPDELCYYTSDLSEGKKKGSIPLKPLEGSVREVWDVPSYCLCISLVKNSKRQYYICFDRKEVFHLWFLAISSLLHQETLYMPLNTHLSLQPGVIKEGNLLKKGQKNKAWKTRYFVLKAGEASTESKLEYYDEQNGKLKGVVDITYQVSVAESKEKEHSFALSLPNGGRQYRFAAAATTLKLEWMKALKSVSRTPKFAFSLIEGVLQKRGEMNTGFKDRYFVLLQDKLLYYRTKQDIVAAGMIPITKQTLCVATTEAPPNPRRISLTEQSSFGRVFFLSSTDHDAIKQWVNQIQIAIAKTMTPISSISPTSASRVQAFSPSTPKSRLVLTGYNQANPLDPSELKSSPFIRSTATTLPPSSASSLDLSRGSNEDLFQMFNSELRKSNESPLFSPLNRASEIRSSTESSFYQPSPLARSSEARNSEDPLFHLARGSENVESPLQSASHSSEVERLSVNLLAHTLLG